MTDATTIQRAAQVITASLGPGRKWADCTPRHFAIALADAGLLRTQAAPVDDERDSTVAKHWAAHVHRVEAELRRTVRMLTTTQAERDELAERLSILLCELTGGRMSKTNYDVRTMVREVEDYFERTADEDLRNVTAERDQLRDWRRKVLDTLGYDDTPEYAQELLDYLPAWKHEHDAVDERVEALTAERDQLRLIANVNGDWNLKFMQLERERDQLRWQVEAVRDFCAGITDPGIPGKLPSELIGYGMFRAVGVVLQKLGAE